MPPEELVIPGGQASGNAVCEPEGMDGVYRGTLHHHASIELCYAAEGCCRLWGTNGCLLLRPDDLKVILPNQTHGEGWHKPELDYRLLWLTIEGDSVIAFVDIYSAGKGWRLSGRVCSPMIGGAMAREALAVYCRDQAPSAGCYQLKGALIMILASLQQLAVDAESGAVAEAHGIDLVEAVRLHLDLHYTESLSVADVASRFGRSTNHLNRVFSQRFGQGIHAYLCGCRLEAANRLLKQHDLMVKEAAFRVGFNDPLHFCRLYKQRFGFPPSETTGHRS